MFGMLKNYKQIRDVEIDIRSSHASLTDVERRRLVPIAIVDDESFAPEQNLKNNGYIIDILGDIKSLDEISSYNIILCDLQGVGRHLNSKTQGAYIIDEIKRNHPEKFVIAYTGGAADDKITIAAQNKADSFLKKDADIEDWRDKLDAIISYLSNPVYVWKRQRYALVDSDASTLDILKLEDAFVRSLEQRSVQPYAAAVSDIGSTGDLRAIGQSLIASGIFKILVG